MSKLSRYVDELFAKYKKNRGIDELKTEVLGNLEAKKEDLIASGKSEAEAVKIAKESITNIDFMIDGNKRVCSCRMKLEFLQQSLIVLLIAWILTVPLLIFHIGFFANILLTAAAAVGIIYYIFYLAKLKGHQNLLYKMGYVNIKAARETKNAIWILWAAVTVLIELSVTAMRFGSNIWFSRHISIDGPSEFASLLITYFIPLLTIVIPIIAGIPLKLIPKYEVGENNEE